MHSGKRRCKVMQPAGVLRSSGGMYMVELMVAVMASSVLAATLVSHFCETSKLTGAGKNQLYAAAIAQQLVDVTRNTEYSHLKDLIGPAYSFSVNADSAGDMLEGNNVFLKSTGGSQSARQLLLDRNTSEFSWTSSAVDNSFEEELYDTNPTVTETISNAGWGTDSSGEPAGLRVDILVRWNEQKMTKSYALTTYISRNGIHNY